MSTVETVKVRNADAPNGFMVINKSDFDPNKHEPHDDEARESVKDKIDASKDGARGLSLTDAEEERRRYEANRGVTGGPALVSDGRNPSGTFSEPTPSDIRFPNKDETEFENNHGAFVKKSAAQMREAQGLPDAPGGLAPQARHVRKDDDGKWFVKHGTEELAGPFDTEDEARAAMESDKVDDSEQSIEQRKRRQDAKRVDAVKPAAPVAPAAPTSGAGTNTGAAFNTKPADTGLAGAANKSVDKPAGA